MRRTRLRIAAACAALALGGALSVAVVAGESAGAATRDIPIGQPMTGSMTFYNDVGFGACGTPVNASTDMLVAVSFQWWTAANPNNDPLCQGISVQVTYNGTTITVPVRDKCPSCDATHIDLSQPAFAQLAPLSVGVVSGITWQFVGGQRVTSAKMMEVIEATLCGNVNKYLVRYFGAAGLPVAVVSPQLELDGR